MCVINNTYNFIFVHIPKCGGTTVTHMLSELSTLFDIEIGGTPWAEQFQKHWSPRYKIFKHSTVREIRAQVGQQVWTRYFTFSIVRNPYTRAYSTFKYLRQHVKEIPAMSEFSTFDEFVMSEYWDRQGPDRMLLPQVHWLRRNEWSEEASVNYIGKLEELETSMTSIADHLGCRSVVNWNTITARNVSKEPKKTPDLSAAALEKIQERYKPDFEQFGYDIDAVPFKVVEDS